MGLGSVVKYYRLKAGMTQNELCREICSVSHLSKIENDSYDANEETLSLLFQRLGLELKAEQEKIKGIEEEIHSLLKAIRFLDEENIREIYVKLDDNKEYCLSSKLLLLYQITLMWYFNWTNDIKEAEKIQNLLEKMFKNMNSAEKCLYILGYAQTLQKSNEPLKALNYLEERVEFIYSAYEQDFFYQLGLYYSYINNPEKAILYIKKCLVPFQDSLNFMKILSSHVIMAINYVRIGMLEEASSTYSNVLRNLRFLGKDSFYHKNLYNFALLLKEKESYEDALVRLKQCTKYFLPKSDEYILCKLNIIEIYLKINENNEVILKEIEEVIELTSDPTFNFFHLYALRYKYELVYPPKKLYAFIENKLLPFLYSINNFEEAKELELEIAKFYEDIDPPKAISYYKTYIKRGDV